MKGTQPKAYFHRKKIKQTKQKEKSKSHVFKENRIPVPSKPVWKAKNKDELNSKVESNNDMPMTVDISLLHDLQIFDGGYVSFAGSEGGKISKKGNHVRDLPIKEFFSIEKCVACAKGKQHRKPHKSKLINSIDCVLHLLHMDLFGHVNVMSIGHKSYCLVITDDYLRFSWVFFLANKSETAELIKNFIILVENQRDVKCSPYTATNGVAERKNRTLIEAARTMLSESRFPLFFWAEAVNTACYVLNRVLLNKRFQMTPYEILYNEKPRVGYFRAFGCPFTVLHTKSTPKFNEKDNECYFVGYGSNTTAYIVYNKVTKEIRESTYVDWQEQNPTDAECGPSWLFDYHSLFKSFNIFTNVIARSYDESFELSDDEDGPYTGPLLTVDPPEPVFDTIDEFNEETQENVTNLPSTVPVPETPSHRINKDHAVDSIIGSLTDGVKTRSTAGDINICLCSCFISHFEPVESYLMYKMLSFIVFVIDSRSCLDCPRQQGLRDYCHGSSVDIFNIFAEYTTAKDLWAALCTRYEGSEDVRESKRDLIKKQYAMFSSVRGESISDLINRFSSIVSRLKVMGVEYPTLDINKKLLDSLPKEWNMYQIMIKKTENLSALSQQEVYSILESYEIEIKKGAVTPSNQSGNTALIAGSSSSGSPYFRTDVPPSAAAINSTSSSAP
ncbi:hypothetical protein L1987_18703 [Smallanthus sonchifolius]|uniref:Uncharacterized protein n=1 Tax=Smallanthus sonchifolius TaxID=185202 RepID=A0ACB9J0T2_9ASTR|nr:hypothetical protein L1987_18703 [Smallanthus sonchifolius]